MSDLMSALVMEVFDLRRRVGALETIETTMHKLALGSTSGLTIAAGEITITQSYHQVDTQGAAGSDDLDTINGGSAGSLLILAAVNAARTIVCKDGTGNLLLAGDFSLDSNQDAILLFKASSNWVEISRSDNA